LHNGSHDALVPKRLRQPVADFASVRLADLQAVETAPADQGIVGRANGPMNRTALLLGDLGDQGEPFVGSGVVVRGRNAKRAVVEVLVCEMLEKGRLVRGAELGQMHVVVDDDFHGVTRGHIGVCRLSWEDSRSSSPVRWLFWFRT